MFFYLKNQHGEEVPAMYEYADLFMSERMIGPMGYLKGIGLIPASDEAREEARAQVASKEQLQLSDLQQ